MLKRIVILSLLMSILMFAQVPEVISFQGRLSDSLGTSLPDGVKTLYFKLYTSAIGGASIWDETQDATTSAGLFSVMLGSANPFGASVNFNNPLWLSVQVVGFGSELSPRYELGTSPYAFVAKTANSVDWDDIEGMPAGYVDGVDDEGASYSAGDGIDISSDVISVADFGINTGKIADAAVDGSKIDHMGATSGQVLKWNGATWAPANDIGGGTGDDWGAQVVQHDASLDGQGIIGNLLAITTNGVRSVHIADGAIVDTKILDATITGDKLSNMGASSGQVLKWNGSIWAPANDIGGGTGDDWGTQVVQHNTTISGNGTSLSPLGVALGGVDWFNLTPAVRESIQYGGGIGDDWGSQVIQHDPTLSGDGTTGNELTLAQQGATISQVLKWNGASWAPASDEIGAAGTGDITSVIAGEGLSGGGTAGDVTVNANFEGTGTAVTIARSDHDHDAIYYTKTELNTSGGGGQVNWDNITDMPTGFADGIDDASGGSAIPAGTDGQVQFNNGGSFGGTSAIYFNDDSNYVGIGTNTPSYLLHVEGGAPSTSLAYFKNTDIDGVYGVFSECINSDYSGMGGCFRGGIIGIRGEARPSSAGSSIYVGVEGSAINSSGTNIGLRAFAYGGLENWAGYFQIGDVYMGNKLAIGTTTPEFKLSLDYDGGIIAKGTFTTGETLITSGPGARLIWYPRKAAFRVGETEGPSWNDSQIGNHSVAMGLSTNASGGASTALNAYTQATSIYSTAMGFLTHADGVASIAMGSNNTASGDYSVVMGFSNTSTGNSSVSMGFQSNATNDVATSIGTTVTANGINSFAAGQYLTAGPASNTIVFGKGFDYLNQIENDIANSFMVGFNSNLPTMFVGPASGVGTTGNVGIGTTNPDAPLTVKQVGDTRSGGIKITDNESLNPFVLTISIDTMGDYAVIQSEHVYMHFDDLLLNPAGGNIGIGNSNPAYLLTMESSGGGYYGAGDHAWHNGSSIRWKENIKPIENALDIVSKLQGVTYNFDQERGGAPSIGFIAEDVAKILPCVVSMDQNAPGYASGMNYANLVALENEAVKELNTKVETLQKENDLLKTEMSKLKKAIEKLGEKIE